MMRSRQQWVCAALGATLFGSGAVAADLPDPSTLYSVSTEGSSKQVKVGQKGSFVLSIHTEPGAHISEEAPLKLEIAGKNVTPAKALLVRADSVAKKETGKPFTDPRFEVPFVTTAAGKGALDAKLTLFVCTATVCSRQQKSVSVAVDVL